MIDPNIPLGRSDARRFPWLTVWLTAIGLAASLIIFDGEIIRPALAVLATTICTRLCWGGFVVCSREVRTDFGLLGVIALFGGCWVVLLGAIWL